MIQRFSTVLWIYCAFCLCGRGILSKDAHQPTHQTLFLTIYPNFSALVRDTRHIKLAKGRVKVTLSGFPALFSQNSFLLKSESQSDVIFNEMAFQQDILSLNNLLTRSVGREILLLNPNGQQKRVFLLSFDKQGALVRHQGMIQHVPLERLAFLELPRGLSGAVSLHLGLEIPKAHVYPLELTYLTKGFSWCAHYTLEVDSQKGAVDMIGWVSLKNESGMHYKHAWVQLASDAPPLGSQEQLPVKVPHFYVLQDKLSLYDQALKKVIFLRAKMSHAKSFFVLPLPFDIPKNKQRHKLEILPQVWFKMRNDPANQIGFPLPPGEVRIYALDPTKQVRFAGCFKMPHVAKGDYFEVPVDVSPVVQATFQLEFMRELGRAEIEKTYRLDITNTSKEEKNLQIRKSLRKGSALSYTSQEVTENKRKLLWNLTVPPQQTISLVYRIKVASSQFPT
jgi:hypothetical protein